MVNYVVVLTFDVTEWVFVLKPRRYAQTAHRAKLNVYVCVCVLTSSFPHHQRGSINRTTQYNIQYNTIFSLTQNVYAMFLSIVDRSMGFGSSSSLSPRAIGIYASLFTSLLLLCAFFSLFLTLFTVYQCTFR